MGKGSLTLPAHRALTLGRVLLDPFGYAVLNIVSMNVFVGSDRNWPLCEACSDFSSVPCESCVHTFQILIY